MAIDRAKRMVDFGLDEARISFDLGADPTEDEINAVLGEIDKLPEAPTVSEMADILEREDT